MKNFYYGNVKLENGLKFGLIYNPSVECIGAAIYTKSDVQAAPILVSKQADSRTIRKQAIVINSGNANAFTGQKGLETARYMATVVARKLELNDGEVYVASTGVIGRHFPNFDLEKAICKAIEKLSPNNLDAFAESIMTTDTRSKIYKTEFEINEKKASIVSIAKGAGMIMPDMATMIACVLTDVNIEKVALLDALRIANDSTFNCISVDGDTSTNDCVFAIADGSSENPLIKKDSAEYKIFLENLTKVLTETAKGIVNDGEGITKFITIDIKGTRTKEEAQKLAFSIANSPLVKTAFYGESYNWGRLMMAMGKARTGLNFNIIDLLINNFPILEDGNYIPNEQDENTIRNSLKNHDVSIMVNCKQGNQEIRIWTCDFSLDYVKINADYVT